MPRRRRSVTTISGLLSLILPTVKLSNRWMREAQRAAADPPGKHRRIVRQCRVRDPHRAGSCGGKRGPLCSGIDRRGDLAAIELDRKEQMVIGGRPADLDFGVESGPVRRTNSFLIERHPAVRQVEIDVELAEHVGSEDAVDLRQH